MQQEKERTEQEVQLIIFTVNEIEYGIHINDVLEVIRVQPVTPLPHGPTFIKGVINLRGKVIPVMDLRERFNVSSIEDTRKTRIMIVNLENKEVGIIVDSVIDVETISKAKIEPPLPVIGGLKMEYINGIAKFDNRLVIILNIEKILTSEEKILLQESMNEEQTV